MMFLFYRRFLSITLAVFLFQLACFVVVADNKDSKKELSKNKTELNKLDNAIKADKKKVNQLKVTEKKHKKIIQSYANEYESISRNIQKIERDLKLVTDTIDYLSYILSDANTAISRTRENFTKIVSSIYTLESSRGDKLPAYFSYRDKNLDKLLFRHISSTADKKVKNIHRFIDSTQILISELNEKIDRQEQLRSNKDREKLKLNKLISQHKSKVDEIRHDVGELEKQIRQRERSSKALRELIQKLSQEEKPQIASKEKPVTTPSSKLFWPCTSRNITRYFGTATDAATGLEFDNPGIDILANYGSPVFAAESGEVSLLHWLPGYGSIIVIHHGGSQRSVYGNILTLNVKKGQKVSRGMIIGTSGRSIDGEILHFEVWNGNKRVNPLIYLK